MLCVAKEIRYALKKGAVKLQNSAGFSSKIRKMFKNKSFIFQDYLLLAALLALFQIFWWGFTKGSNVAVTGPFYTRGFQAKYDLDGTAAKTFGTNRLVLKVVESSDKTATVRINAGKKSRQFVIDRKTSKILIGPKSGIPLIFCYDAVIEPNQISATFGKDLSPEFSTEFTPLKGPVYTKIKKKNSDNVVMWYHKSAGTSYGPQFSWELGLFDSKGTRVGTIVNDITSGILLDARFYENGWGSINLLDTNYPTGLNRWAIFVGYNAILFFWGIFHVVRAKRHPEEWQAHWEYFDLNFFGISKFFIRLMAFTIFGFFGFGILTGDPYKLLVSDLIGFGLMIYAVGPFAFLIVFKFIQWIAAFGVFAGGRPLEYVQYPFGVLLYLSAVVCYLINRRSIYRNLKLELLAVADKLPEEEKEKILRRFGERQRKEI